MTKTGHIIIEGIPIELKVRRIKRMHLYVCPPDGEVRASVPARMSMKQATAFIVSKIDWIKKHRESFKAAGHAQGPDYSNGQTLSFEGRKCALSVINRPGRAEVCFNGNDICLYIKEGAPFNERKIALAKWYKSSLEKRIPAFIDRWQRAIGVKASEWRIRSMKTRWGSCSIKARRIWLNLELAKRSDECLDYIIAHELTHLIEGSHNRRFHSLMDFHLPAWREIRSRLRDTGDH